MATVAVTGCSGYLGRLVCEALDGHDGVTRVVGVDVREPDASTGNLEFYRMDVRSSHFGDVITGCDAVVHLAVAYDHDVRDTIVEGTHSVLSALLYAQKLIFVSSGAVYGAHADNDVPLREDAPLRPTTLYGNAKLEAESAVASFAQEHPGIVCAVLRPAWILGPRLPARLAAVVESPVRLAAAGHRVPFQALHEDDAVGAVLHLLDNDLPGTFNVCADDAVERPEALLGQRRLTLGIEQVARFREVAARAGLLPVPDLGALQYSEVMSNNRLRATGWAPGHTSAEALSSAAEARRGWIAIGGVRFKPRWAVMAAASVAAMAIGSAARRTRRAT